MARILIFFIGLGFISGLKAQEWFPVGASWYYTQIIIGMGESYNYFEVTGEILLQGKNCKVISGTCFCGDGVGGYVYQEGDKIFAFDSDADSFKLLYDFSLVAGDTLVYKGDPQFGGDGFFLIDSVTFIQAGSQNLRVQHISYPDYPNFQPFWLGNKIIERIGSSGCLYPEVDVCDPLSGGLRCYEDDETGLLNFQTPPRPCDYVTTAIDDPSAARVLKIYPNPATNVVHIHSEKPIESLILFNNLAISVYQHSPIHQKEIELNVNSLPLGLYRIQVILADHQIVQRSIVIQY